VYPRLLSTNSMRLSKARPLECELRPKILILLIFNRNAYLVKFLSIMPCVDT
jgi:hypothetical protein